MPHRPLRSLAVIGLIVLGLAMDGNAAAEPARQDALPRDLVTGLRIAGRMARVHPLTSGVLAVGEGTIVLGDTLEAGVDATSEAVEERLFVISYHRQALEELRRRGRLSRDDPEFAAIASALAEERRELEGKSAGDLFLRTVQSRRTLTRMLAVPAEHYATAFLGKTGARWIGAGPRIQGAMLDPRQISRDMPRAVWKKSQGFDRLVGNALDEVHRRLLTVAGRAGLEAGRADAEGASSPTAKSRAAGRARTYLTFAPPVLGAPEVTPTLPSLVPGLTAQPPMATPPMTVPLPPMATPPMAAPMPPMATLPGMPVLSPVPAADPPVVVEPPPAAPPAEDPGGKDSGSSGFRPGKMPSFDQLRRIKDTGNW